MLYINSLQYSFQNKKKNNDFVPSTLYKIVYSIKESNYILIP